MNRRDHSTIDSFGPAAILAIFLLHCAISAAHAALFVPPKPRPVPPDDGSCHLRIFPGPEACRQAVQIINAHRAWVDNHLLMVPPHERLYWQQRSEDMYWRWDVWADLQAAHQYEAAYQCNREDWSKESRDMYLANVRRKLGDDLMWHCGYMPPPLPVWLFRRID